jgi:hypothetical protein
MKKIAMILCVAALVFAVSASAADAPNFSGEWKMNASKSDFGQRPGPDSMTRKIEHAEPSIAMTTTQSGQMGEMTSEFKFTTDGKESESQQRRGTAKVSAKWDGKVLVVVTKRTFTREGETMEITSTDRWNLSEDGKTLTVDSVMQGPWGEGTSKLVMDKQ